MANERRSVWPCSRLTVGRQEGYVVRGRCASFSGDELNCLLIASVVGKTRKERNIYLWRTWPYEDLLLLCSWDTTLACPHRSQVSSPPRPNFCWITMSGPHVWRNPCPTRVSPQCQMLSVSTFHSRFIPCAGLGRRNSIIIAHMNSTSSDTAYGRDKIQASRSARIYSTGHPLSLSRSHV